MGVTRTKRRFGLMSDTGPYARIRDAIYGFLGSEREITLLVGATIAT